MVSLPRRDDRSAERDGPAGPRTVGPVRPTDDGRDRAQLVLVGGVIVAVMLVGLVVVFNSALYTENIDKGGSAQSGRDATTFASEVQRNTRSVAIRVGHGQDYSNPTSLGTALENNFSSYGALLSEAYVDSESAAVSVTYDHAESTYGWRLLQHSDQTYRSPSAGANTWQPVTVRRDVGWLVLNLNVSQLSTTDAFTVRLDNASTEMSVSFRQNASGYVIVKSAFPSRPAANSTASCWPVRGRLLVDVLGGEVYGRSCEFNATEHLAPPYILEFDGANHASGRYEIVVDDGDPTGQDSSVLSTWFDSPGPHQCSAGGPNPCRAVAVWSANVSVDYRSAQVDYARSWNMEVYNETHGPP